MASELRQAGFDYSVVPHESRAKVEAATSRLHTLERQTSEAIIEIGKELIQVKADIGHGNFLPWLESEFGWSTSTATKMMQVATTFGDKSVTVTNLGAKVLYALAAPSTPDEIRAEFTELAQLGNRVTHKEVQERIQESRRAEPIPVSEWDREPIDVDEDTGEIRDPAPAPRPGITPKTKDNYHPSVAADTWFEIPSHDGEMAYRYIQRNMLPEAFEVLRLQFKEGVQ